MKKKKKNTMQIMSSYEATLANMQKYNPYQTGYGAWKSAKHPSRAKAKDMIRKRKDDY